MNKDPIRLVKVGDVIKFDKTHHKSKYALIIGYYIPKERPELFENYFEFTRGNFNDKTYYIQDKISYILYKKQSRRSDITIVTRKYSKLLCPVNFF